MTDLRDFTPDMAAACAELMHEAVHHGAADHYSVAELFAWSPEPMTEETFLQRTDDHTTLTAWRGTHLLGFMSLRNDGLLDLGYVAPHLRGTGVADALLAELVYRAREAGMAHLTAHASRPARSFLRRHGWFLLRPNIAFRAGQRLETFEMEFPL